MKELAKALKTTEAKAEKALKAAKLDGDEMCSLSYAYGLDYVGDGAVGDKKIEIAFAKVKKALR